MQARYYDPVIGRFYSNDPADVMEHIARGNPIHGFNRYTYANNNPYKYVDPDGEFGLLGAAIGAFVGGVSSIAVQSFTGDGKINWSTVGAATATGAAVGATGGLAGAAVAKIGLTGAEAAATVLLPSSGVAAVGGALTQMVENTANGDPLNKGVALSAGAAATGTIVGGVTGDKIVGASCSTVECSSVFFSERLERYLVLKLLKNLLDAITKGRCSRRCFTKLL